MEKKILKQLRSDYEKQEIKPSASLWDNVEEKMDLLPENTSRKTFGWWKYAAVVLLLISVAGLFISNDKSSHKIQSSTVENNLDLNNTVLNSEFLKDENISRKTREITPVLVNQPKKIFRAERKIKTSVIQENIAVIPHKDQSKINETPTVKAEKIAPQIAEPVLAEKKKSAYISADELLLGRELDKTREETRNQRQFGVVDASRLKIKRPNSFRILGFKVISDSVMTDQH